MNDDRREYLRAERQTRLMERAVIDHALIRTPAALRHLKEGFNRRLLMLESSYRFMRETERSSDGKRLSPYTTTDLAIHVNAFYLNLAGALDNLAWALRYDLPILNDITEASPGRVRVSLLGRDFIAAIRGIAPGLGDALNSRVMWFEAMRGLRDPAAHRIPIYPVPGVLSESESARVEALWAEANTAFTNHDRQRGMELQFEAASIGSYEPMMSIPDGDGHLFLNLFACVIRDHDGFFDTAEPVIEYLFARGTQGPPNPASLKTPSPTVAPA